MQCASRSQHCAKASANLGSSPPWAVWATASARNHALRVKEKGVDRALGLRVRLKLTISYAGFVMLAGALLLAAAWLFLLRYVPVRAPTPHASPRPGRFPTGSAFRAAETSSASLPMPTTACSAASKHTSPESKGSPPTPSMNCVPRWPSPKHLPTWPATTPNTTALSSCPYRAPENNTYASKFQKLPLALFD